MASYEDDPLGTLEDKPELQVGAHLIESSAPKLEIKVKTSTNEEDKIRSDVDLTHQDRVAKIF